MKKYFIYLLLIVTMVISLSIFSSCLPTNQQGGTDQGNGDVNNPSDNDNGDNNNESVDVEQYIPVTMNGEAVVKIVSPYSKSKQVNDALNCFKNAFLNENIQFTDAYRTNNLPSSYEIIIGDGVDACDKYYIDPYVLGGGGYAIRVIDNKIIIAGGDDEALAYAINLFVDKLIDLSDPANAVVDRSTDIYKPKTYSIKGISVAGVDLSKYTIVCDTRNEDLLSCANDLHNVLYNNAGYWLNVKNDSNTPKIIIQLTDDAGYDGFRMTVRGGDLIIECAYPMLMLDCMAQLIEDNFAIGEERTIAFTEGNDYTQHISTITYCTYGGAVGDGIADDFDAIKETHFRANITGQTVVGDPGKTFNMGQHNETIKIMTDTIWTGTTFIIDDSDVTATGTIKDKNVFWIVPSHTGKVVSGITSLKAGQTNIGVTFDEPVLLKVYNDNVMQYIRYGGNADSGAPQQEIILVDENGNVDPSTPIMWNYDTVTAAIAYSATDKPITVTGGHFITIANSAPRRYTYYSRGIGITRSNVTIVGIIHTIEGEGDTGAPYNGFLSISNCHNVLIDSARLSGHKVYKLETDSTNSMGTYDISANSANNITWRNCSQTNSITDTSYWGIMGSNYCKNLTYDGCVFSRFDAHKGTYNATIINSEIGHQKISIIGAGTLRIENTVVNGNNIVNLRSDYGSTWQGDVIFRNVTLKNTSTPTLINAQWSNHYFGYTCYLPENITVDGITLDKGTSFYVLPNLKNDVDKNVISGVNNDNPYVLTKKIIIISNPQNYTYAVSKNMTLFGTVVLDNKS